MQSGRLHARWRRLGISSPHTERQSTCVRVARHICIHNEREAQAEK
jgi:hypothetical protein